MAHRFFMWIKSIFSKTFICQICETKDDDYKHSGIIKVKYDNGKIMDLIICKNCIAKLENERLNKR